MVRDAYTSILAGGSITEIARTWNTAGIYGLTGRPWSASTVSLFLRAPRNAGLRAHNDEIVLDADGNPVMGTWPALVDEALWRSVQAIADELHLDRKTVRKHLLTGVLRCGKCGDRLSGLQIGGTKQIAYNCKGCRGVSVRAEHVEPLLEAVIAGRLAKPDAVDLLRADLHDEADAEALRTERATLLSRLNDIADERADGLLTGQQAKRASDRINEKLAAIEARQQSRVQPATDKGGLAVTTPDLDYGEFLRQLLRDAKNRTEAIHTAYQHFENAGLILHVIVHRYLCKGCGKKLATVIRLGDTTIARTTDYKFSPGLNLERSVESARERSTLDGDRHWHSFK